MKFFFKYVIWYIILISGLFFIQYLDIPLDIKDIIFKIDKSLLIFLIALPIINSSGRFIQRILERMGSQQIISSIVRNILKTGLFIIAGLVILDIFDISITPLLATLGVGGLAIALALKDTLSDFFAGFYLTALKQIQIGNYIELDTGEKGYVEDINWRNTQIRVLANNLILIPNSKVMAAKIKNYELPVSEMSVLVQVGVHYLSDLDFVEKVTIEVAKDVAQTVEGGVCMSEPFIRYHTFGDFSINFSVILRAQNFVSQYLVKHEFIKRLHKRYKKENIVIPFPIVALNNEQEKV